MTEPHLVITGIDRHGHHVNSNLVTPDVCLLLQGKTYSMIGPRLGTTNFDKQQLLTEDDGFLARAYANVFQSIEGHQSDMHVEVRASCCEVYHEQVSKWQGLVVVHSYPEQQM
jgi:hypothetical protein